MITPKSFERADERKINGLIEKIDNSMLSNHGHYDYELAIIDDEFPIVLRNAVAKRYKDVGWKYVYHRTSSENDERPGLTSFIFSQKELSDCIVKGYHVV